MEETVVLTDGEQRFVEAMGLHFDGLGAPRIGGRVFGLLMVAPRPLTLEEIAEILLVSKASVSTNTRFFLQLGIIEARAIPGDRRRFYAFSHQAWEHRLQVGVAQARALQKLVELGEAAVRRDNAEARERLEVMGAFARFLEDASADMQARWKELHLAIERKVS